MDIKQCIWWSFVLLLANFQLLAMEQKQTRSIWITTDMQKPLDPEDNPLIEQKDGTFRYEWPEDTLVQATGFLVDGFAIHAAANGTFVLVENDVCTLLRTNLVRAFDYFEKIPKNQQVKIELDFAKTNEKGDIVDKKIKYEGVAAQFNLKQMYFELYATIYGRSLCFNQADFSEK